MEGGPTPHTHWPSNAALLVLLVLATIAAVIDLWDGYDLKALTTILIVAGLVALLQARRFESSRWRMIAQLAFMLALAGLFIRLATSQGWV